MGKPRCKMVEKEIPAERGGIHALLGSKPSTGRSKHGEGLAEGKENKGGILFSLAGSFRLAGEGRGVANIR